MRSTLRMLLVVVVAAALAWIASGVTHAPRATPVAASWGTTLPDASWGTYSPDASWGT